MNPYNSPGARCCVFDCAERVRGQKSKFYKFPPSKALLDGESVRKRWIDAVRIPKKLSKDMVVCHRHFKKEDYVDEGGRRKLKPEAVPSQNLPTIWRNKFYPRDYGRLVKLVEVRGIGRLRMCFEAKLGRRLKQSQEKRSKSRRQENEKPAKESKKNGEKIIDSAASKNEDADEVTIVPTEDASGTKKQTVPVPLPPILSSTDPFTSEIDIKDEPLSDTEDTIEDILAKMNDEPSEPKKNIGLLKQPPVKAPCGVCETGACKCKEQNQSPGKGLSKSATVSCSVCMIGFSSAELLAEHNKSLHNEPTPQPFVCLLCNDSFKTKVELMDHVAGHAIINSFRCKVCAQYFVSQEDRDDHFRRHRIVKKEYVCRECKAVLRTRAACWDHLNNHIRSRLKSAGNPCDVCGRVLSTRITLKEHMLIHSGEKPFECQLCGRKIRHRTNFLLHVQGHTLGLPHQCGSCGMSFLKKSELNIHISNEHPELKDYNCSICGITFKTESRFVKHAISHNAQLEE